MKSLLILAVVFFSFIVNGQSIKIDSSFSFLKGFEEKNGSVYLFYRISAVKNLSFPNSSETNHVYKLNLQNNESTFFLSDEYSSYQFTGTHHEGTGQIEFFNKVENYFWVQIYCTSDCDIRLMNKEIGIPGSYSMSNFGYLNVSQQDPNLIVWGPKITYSGNFNTGFAIPNCDLVSILPQNDSIMYGCFFVDEKKILKKSVDRGISFQTIDTSFNWNLNINNKPFQYSSDGSVIYTSLNNYPLHNLAVSKDFGESWEIVYSDSSKFYFSFAPYNPAEVFITKDNSILKSENYGLTFLPYQTVKEEFLGIYKHPSQDLVYAITKNNLYELNSDHTTPLLKIVTGVSETPMFSDSFILFPNYPNPFNPTTQIRFYNPKTAQIKIDIYDSLGRLVETINNQIYTPGNHSIEFNASNLTSGIYFYSVSADNFQKTGKMTLIR